MERTVPSATSEEIQLYRTTLYSLLRSTTEIQIRTLEEAHAGMNSLLHPDARSWTPDLSAFIYSSLRLPDCMPQVRSVVLGQSEEVFARFGYAKVESLVLRLGPRPPPALLLRRLEYPGLLHRLSLRHRRHPPVADRLPNRVEQDAPAALQLACGITLQRGGKGPPGVFCTGQHS